MPERITCDNETFCTAEVALRPGQMLAEALREAGWKHVRLPMGKVKNLCPEHKVRP